jgi:uncharacterized protein
LKLHAQAPSNLNTVTGYGPDHIDVNRVRHAGALILTPDSPVQAWEAGSLADLQAAHFAAVLALGPELVLIGTGATQRFLPPLLTLPLVQARIGFEVMDSAAACRTFNILVAEGRRVVAAFLAPGPAADPAAAPSPTPGAPHA